MTTDEKTPASNAPVPGTMVSGSSAVSPDTLKDTVEDTFNDTPAGALSDLLPDAPKATSAHPLMASLEVVLVGTRFPENVGMAARACANMGCAALTLVAPERWNAQHREKARPLATPKGEPLLDRVRVADTLEQALAPCVMAIGTTARTGGWRRSILLPEEAAAEAAPLLAENERVALVFGREDRGLTNDELEHCHRLVSIPTAGASSLNLAQAVLVLLYAHLRAGDGERAVRKAARKADPGELSRRVRHDELELIYGTIRETLLDIDYLRPDNPDYFLMPLRRFLGKAGLRRHEMDMLMGICRQIRSRTKGKQP